MCLALSVSSSFVLEQFVRSFCRSYLKQLNGMSMDTKCDHARFCRVDRTYQHEQARITLAVDRSGVRDPVVSTTDPTVSRTPTVAGHPTRQVGSEGVLRAVSMWLGERDHSSKPEVVLDDAERGSATYGDGFKGEHRAAFSALVSCFFGGTVLVGRRDAMRKVCVSLADFFDVERNLATILSHCFAELWEQCLFCSECEEQWIFWEASTWFG